MLPADLGGRALRAPAVIPATLAFEGLERHFGAIRAVDGVDLMVKAGEVICLLGESGCGKSTLLRLAAGIEKPGGGRILMDGREISGPNGQVPPEKRGVGLVFQDYALFPHLDALGNVMFGLSNLSKREALAIADAALRRVGLGERMRQMPHDLSGGEQQRVALARAIVPRPRVLLMDEPFSNLDRQMRDSVREETVALLRETGATALIVTHDPEEAMRIADRIVLMRKGKIAQVGPAHALYGKPVDLAAARFFSDINEISGIFDGEAVETPIGRFPAIGLAKGQRAIVAIRPQSIEFVGMGQGVPARVVSRRYVGIVDLISLAVEGLDVLLRARIRDLPPDFTVGDVGLRFNPREVLVFAAEQN